MTDKINNKMRTFLASTLIQSLKNQNPSSWRGGVYYSIGTQVLSDNKIFVATNTGTSADIAPTHSVGTALDGTVQWLFLSNSIGTSDIASNLYLGLGKNYQWNETDTPIDAQTNSNAETDTLNDLVSLIKINSTNTRLGLKKQEWVSGTVYSQFSPNMDLENFGEVLPSLYVTIDGDVYKCIDNNKGSQSTEQPSGKQLGLVLLSDGYIWKYMGSVEEVDTDQFTTDEYIPISQKYSNDGSEQWFVQQQAQNGSISTFSQIKTVGNFSTNPSVSVEGVGSGAIASLSVNNSAEDDFDVTRVYITNPGKDYTQKTFAVIKNSGANGSGATIDLEAANGSVSVTGFTGGANYSNGAVVVLVGDGEGAEASITVSSGIVTSVDILDPGTGYTWAQAFVIPGDAGAVSQAVMSPVGGHGKDIVSELGVNTVLFSSQIAQSLNPYVIENGEYRQISLVSSAQPVADGKFNAATYIGPKHPDYDLNPENLDKYQSGTGNILYINNIEAITHTSEQEEIIKIAITF